MTPSDSRRRSVAREAFTDPLIVSLFVTAVVLALVIGAAFLLLLAGDALGVWDFDSGLGCEKGDGGCDA
jgi:multisubunit Na+/H+ antiporter MnhC subunit